MATSHGGRRKINTTQAGYGHRHQMLRREVAPFVESGQASCCRCGYPITPGSSWHLDHDDVDRSRYVGVSHAWCNTSAGARKGNALRRERLSAEARAIAWAQEYELDQARLARECAAPTPRIF